MPATHVTFTAHDDGSEPLARFFSDGDRDVTTVVLDQDEEEMMNALVVRIMLRTSV